MIPVFLIGGGWSTEAFPETFGRFANAATSGGMRKIAIIVAEEPDSEPHQAFLRFREAFEIAGLAESEIVELIVSVQQPLTAHQLEHADPTGVFVCGGLTPAYHDALCYDTSWVNYLEANNIPYCGFSAGAAIASKQAIVGGWLREIGGRTLEIANENTSEDIEILDVRSGLGLVPFAVDAHATQWGTLSRLIHAVEAELVSEGWAIDENTMLEVSKNSVAVRGAGSAYRVRPNGARVLVELFHTGIAVSL